MNISEAASLLNLTRDEVKIAILQGIKLPQSKRVIYLEAQNINGEFDIDDTELDTFIALFDAEEPGRHPPVAVARELLVEARHRCAICLNPVPLEFHHIIEWASIKHYDARHMLALCPTCHAGCTRGTIDRKAQQMYKSQVKQGMSGTVAQSLRGTFLDPNGPLRFSWDDLRALIITIHTAIPSLTDKTSKYDYSDTDIEHKNRLNGLGDNYFAMMKVEHEPYFQQIVDFLRHPVNSLIADLYYDIVDDLRSKIAADRDKFPSFEHLLLAIRDLLLNDKPVKADGSRRFIGVLLSFMYFNCDIGRKK